MKPNKISDYCILYILCKGQKLLYVMLNFVDIYTRTICLLLIVTVSALKEA